MKTEYRNNGNMNATTGAGWLFGIDMDRGFYVSDTIGSIDAPGYIVTGSTVENIFEPGENFKPNGARFVINNIVPRE